MKIVKPIPVLTFLMLSALLTSCGVVEGIFKAGMGFGIFIVVVLIGLIIYFVKKIGNNKN